MYTSFSIAKFFEKFQQQFSAYNFVGALYSPEMDFAKLKPYILNNKTSKQRDNNWMGIIFTRQTAQPGQNVYRGVRIVQDWEDPETKTVTTFKCANSSVEVNFNIVTNELEHLEALENELRWFYNGRYEYTIDLKMLPSFKLDIGDITYGDITKYPTPDFGQICSLGMACTLNYPILLRNNDINVIRKINHWLGSEIPKNVIYSYSIETDNKGSSIFVTPANPEISPF